jgi:uncharacterized membrane protein
MFGPLFIPIFLFIGWLIRKHKKAAWRWGWSLALGLILLLYLLSLLLGYLVARTDLGPQLIAAQGETSLLGLFLSALKHRLSFGFSLLTLASLLGVGVAYLIGTASESDSEEESRSPTPFLLLMIVLGGVMVLAPEFVYLRDNFGARMNTIFKFYYQAWMLWSLAAAFATVLILKKGVLIAKIVVILVFGLGLLYPGLAYLDKTNGFNPPQGYNLDAGAYMAQYQPEEAAAIAWLSEAETGTVAEAIGGQYSGYARVATLSGQPAVLGWPGHEGQWRGGYEEVGSREGDIRTLYETPDWTTAQEIIRRYAIHYIYVGGLEWSTYAVNIAKFEQNLSPGFQQGNVTVFVVPLSLLK